MKIRETNNESRIQLIDFFRGLVIFDMILVHFSGYLPLIVSKIVSYTDIAMEGFLFLTGFMLGRHYFPNYIKDRYAVTKRLLKKTAKIFVIQYIFILTINLPLYYLLFDKIRQKEKLLLFFLKSIFFLNQIGLIHILPTFIPLLLISPIILYFFSKKHSRILFLCSIGLFAIGNKYPYALNLGTRTIFPVILWQIYFIAGCILGREAFLKNRIGPDNAKKYLYGAAIVLFFAMFIRHGKIIPPTLTSKFPLNAMGLFYGASIMFFIYTATLTFWNILCKNKFLVQSLSLFGRNSLLVFFIHVYTAYSIVMISKYYANNYLNCILGISSIFFIFIVIKKYEDSKKLETFPLLIKSVFS